ncbi:MAG: hypothetical protein KDB15_14680 [Microthrixaceae bacterium]|nr:hypothetical protein [Microthrixaceae bacterium]
MDEPYLRTNAGRTNPGRTNPGRTNAGRTNAGRTNAGRANAVRPATPRRRRGVPGRTDGRVVVGGVVLCSAGSTHDRGAGTGRDHGAP